MNLRHPVIEVFQLHHEGKDCLFIFSSSRMSSSKTLHDYYCLQPGEWEFDVRPDLILAGHRISGYLMWTLEVAGIIELTLKCQCIFQHYFMLLK